MTVTTHPPLTPQALTTVTSVLANGLLPPLNERERDLYIPVSGFTVLTQLPPKCPSSSDMNRSDDIAWLPRGWRGGRQHRERAGFGLVCPAAPSAPQAACGPARGTRRSQGHSWTRSMPRVPDAFSSSSSCFLSSFPK